MTRQTVWFSARLGTVLLLIAAALTGCGSLSPGSQTTPADSVSQTGARTGAPSCQVLALNRVRDAALNITVNTPLIVRLFNAFSHKRDRFEFQGQTILALSYPSLFSTVRGSIAYARQQLGRCATRQRTLGGCGGVKQLNDTVLPLIDDLGKDLEQDQRLYPISLNGVLRAIGPQPPYRFPPATHLDYAIRRFDAVLGLARSLHTAARCSAYLGF